MHKPPGRYGNGPIYVRYNTGWVSNAVQDGIIKSILRFFPGNGVAPAIEMLESRGQATHFNHPNIFLGINTKFFCTHIYSSLTLRRLKIFEGL